jgi:hypothetical protein
MNDKTQADAAIAGSNSLADLAARIRVEHTAVSTALKDSVKHAIAAGELLLEAKSQLAHGQWLPWLRDHCAISERTAQLYMRVAKNRAEIEAQIRNDVADLTLSEAAAMLALSSDVRRLFRFVKELDGLDDPEDILKACLDANIPVIVDKGYNPVAGRSDVEILEWHLFILFLSCDTEAHRAGFAPKGSSQHVEWVLQRPFQNVAEWLGEEGDKFRKRWGMPSTSEQFKADWAAFLAKNCDRELASVVKELDTLQRRVEREIAAGIISTPRRRRGARVRS